MKLFYTIFISLLSVVGHSQTILYQNETTTRTVQDPQTVIMATGFRATSGVSNPFVAKIGSGTENPGGGSVDSGAGASNPSGTTAPPGKSFHDTKGNIEVNGAGQLQFTLPIALPPGVKSVAPQINLVYTSGSGNGIAGYGWNISGITAISRVGKNIEKDGEVKGIQLDYSDYYSFNGQRLILKSGEYGKDGAEYVTEKYSNVKIKSVGTITGQAWQGPEYWEVTFEDGSEAWYGATASGNSTARTPLEYPVTFSYPAAISSEIDYYGVLPNNTDSFDDIKLTGDFNGDSYIDFLMSNGVLKLGAFNDNYTNINTNKVFDSRSKVVNTLLDEQGEIYNGNGIVQFEGGKIVGYIFRNNTFEKVFEKMVYDTSNCTSQGGGVGCRLEVDSINEGDVNGDGISDIFLSLSLTECLFVPSNLNRTSNNEDIESRPPPGYELECNSYSIGNFIVDLKNQNNPITTYIVNPGINESLYGDQKYMDVDGDGKVETINVSNTAYTVFEFIKNGTNSYLKKVKFTGSLVESKDPNFPVLFGDFNGDNNMDFVIPITNSQAQDNWRFYMGTDIGFQNILKTNFLKYRKPNQDVTWSLLDHHFYSVTDVNKDGKSDIVFVYSKNTVGGVSNSGNALWRTLQYEIRTLQSKGGTEFINSFNSTSPSYNVGGGEDGLFQPLIYPIKSNNNYYDIFIFKNTRVHKYKTQTSLTELSQIKSIHQAEIATGIIYKELNPDIDSNFYKKTKSEIYPYFSLKRVDKSFTVSQMQQGNRKQDFRYRGMTGHLQGKGVIGFNQSARSSWYADGFENTKIWSGVEIDPLNEAVPVKEWSIRTNDESKIFPADISENNTQLLRFKSTTYQTDKLLNGNVVTTVSDADKPKIVTAIIPKSSKTKDFLTGTLTTSNITYGDYYLPSQTNSNVNNGYAISTSIFEYTHNSSGAGANYFIGRPKSKIDVSQAYGDTKFSKEEYT
ncbi:FG-GAP-like repeat-containing protein, partial [Chryseobacterium sp. 2TAF14]|uniref:FG-GAP-like repeat-containing protein n=1 Tax=Chryseobacterium sp. 2TAF14 TaxID=3233007 RepID=UPI003F912DA4